MKLEVDWGQGCVPLIRMYLKCVQQGRERRRLARRYSSSSVPSLEYFDALPGERNLGHEGKQHALLDEDTRI